MTDPYKAMTDTQDAERKAGDAMIEARRAYYSALDDYANGAVEDKFPAELNDAYEAAYTAWEQAHKAAGDALLAWLRTVT